MANYKRAILSLHFTNLILFKFNSELEFWNKKEQLAFLVSTK